VGGQRRCDESIDADAAVREELTPTAYTPLGDTRKTRNVVGECMAGVELGDCEVRF